MTRLEQLSRTIALYKADLGIAGDAAIDAAMRRINVLLAIGHPASSTRAGQSSVLTAAMLLARSGVQVFVLANEGPLVGHHPPFEGSSLHEAVQSVNGELIKGTPIRVGTPDRIDIAFDFGTASSIAPYQSPRTVSVGWSAWSGEISDWPPQPPVTEFDWPMRAMAAAVLVAAEVAKMVARNLKDLSLDAGAVMEHFATSRHARLILAEESTPKCAALGDFTAVSAGAVTNGMFYALCRMPGIHGRMITFDGDCSEQSNLNRNMLLLQRFLTGELSQKTRLLEHFGHGLKVISVPRRFDANELPALLGRVVVGVDHVPTRWLLAQGKYDWMGVGATSHFDVLSSFHYPYSGCPACLHPHDDAAAPQITPTIAYVSFLAGLLLATDLIVDVGGATANLTSKQRFISTRAFGRELSEDKRTVFVRHDCPAGCPASQIKR